MHLAVVKGGLTPNVVSVQGQRDCQRCCRVASTVLCVVCSGTWKHAGRLLLVRSPFSSGERAAPDHGSFISPHCSPLKPLLMTEAQRNLHPGDLSTTNVASYDSKLLLWMNNTFIPAGSVRVRVCTLLRMCALEHHRLVAAAWSCDQGPLITVRRGGQTSFLGNNTVSAHFLFRWTGRPS